MNTKGHYNARRIEVVIGGLQCAVMMSLSSAPRRVAGMPEAQRLDAGVAWIGASASNGAVQIRFAFFIIQFLIAI